MVDPLVRADLCETAAIALWIAVTGALVTPMGDGEYRLTAIGRRLGMQRARACGVTADDPTLVLYAAGLLPPREPYEGQAW